MNPDKAEDFRHKTRRRPHAAPFATSCEVILSEVKAVLPKDAAAVLHNSAATLPNIAAKLRTSVATLGNSVAMLHTSAAMLRNITAMLPASAVMLSTITAKSANSPATPPANAVKSATFPGYCAPNPNSGCAPPLAFAFGAFLKVSSTATFPLGRSICTPASSCPMVRSCTRGNFWPLKALV